MFSVSLFYIAMVTVVEVLQSEKIVEMQFEGECFYTATSSSHKPAVVLFIFVFMNFVLAVFMSVFIKLLSRFSTKPSA